MSFCLLENDQKTFEYFQKYVQLLDRHEETCLQIDNEIQAVEISAHLRINGYSENDISEKIKWIQKNGKPFRDYLNTLKLAYVVWKCCGKEWKDITFEDFQRIRDRINTLKTVCLDAIF